MRLCAKLTTPNFIVYFGSNEPNTKDFYVVATTEPRVETSPRGKSLVAEDYDGKEGKVIGIFQGKFGFAASQVSAIFLSVSVIIGTREKK